MPNPKLEVRQTEKMGRGVFAVEPIAKGSRILEFQGRVLKSADLTDDLLAMQVGPDDWLCSDGSSLDDCVNHSCEPNGGFLQGDLVLYALRDIDAGEEIGWDYSTSIGELGWTLDCRCGFASCRGTVRSWPDLTPVDRDRLQRTALRYLRDLS
jgi:hypothetical protein